MATPPTVKIVLPDSFRYLVDRMKNEISEISDILKWDGIYDNSPIMRARVRLGFDAIGSCAKLAQNIVDNELEIECNDK